MRRVSAVSWAIGEWHCSGQPPRARFPAIDVHTHSMFDVKNRFFAVPVRSIP
jgi:hypothetical protein